MTEIRHPDQVYLDFDQFAGQDGEIALRSKKLVVTRKAHQCGGSVGGAAHEIPTGTEAVFEKALVDGSYWGRYYVCLPCLNKDIAAYGDNDE